MQKSYFRIKNTTLIFKNSNIIREVVKIDEKLCNGCGLCVPGCHEGALQIIDGKARLISDLMCDGLGACIGYCPKNAITTEKREAEPYSETRVMEIMVSKGKNTVIAHLKHLKEHNEADYLREGLDYLHIREDKLGFTLEEIREEVHGTNIHAHISQHSQFAGCPGSRTIIVERPEKIKVAEASSVAGSGQRIKGIHSREAIPVDETPATENVDNMQSELRQWPVQLHLINPQAPYYRNADVLIVADCTAYAMGDFHRNHLQGKSLAIACPKLDSNLEVYVNKITSMIDHAKINTITVMIMQVPCCRGLLQIIQSAVSAAQRKVPVKLMVVGIEGNVLKAV
jgi:ferredoxin